MQKLILTLTLIFCIVFESQCQQTNDIEVKSVNIYSDGTRLSGEIFYPVPKVRIEKHPAILLCHGWGGLKSHLNQSYAPAFAKAGFVVLTFDYRGWGESDSRLVVEGEMPKPDENGMFTVKARAISELVDPIDQMMDIQSAIDYLEGEETVDMERIGIWGTSNGGGLVVQTTIDDARIKVLVSQVGSMHGNWVNEFYPNIHEREIKRARGEIDAVPQGVDKIGELKGTPYLSRMKDFKPIDEVDQIKVPTLLIDAENEELFDRREHSAKVYEIIKDRVKSDYIVVPGIQHYGIYREEYLRGVELATNWFLKHL